MRWNALQEQWETDVLKHIHRRQKIEELKDKTKPPTPVVRERGVISGVQGETINNNFAPCRLLQAG